MSSVVFAVVKACGKQYQVSVGDILNVEKLGVESGEQYKFCEVLFLNTEKDQKVGTPFVAGASVSCKILDNFKDKKVIIFKKKRRSNYRRKNGHRQNLTKIEITSINF